MTVKELIEELKKYPENMIVFTNDSEWGPDQAGSVRVRENEWVWDGPNHAIQNVLIIE